ncbi:MAG TPA: CoA transferase [Candidatus Dormibacteraeota bacterium]|nr:CoA transferase [Candidatus Dormibacteraeota bacterium]
MTERPPLAGIRVVEIGNYMAAPFCAMQLADLGADVVKVETPAGGDTVRSVAPLLDGEGSAFLRLNRNKRSIALDLKSPEGKEVFRRLVAGADVVVENLRPGTMKDLELDYSSLSRINRRLVYVAASGWGQDGPLKDRAGLDIAAQARSGLMSITGQPGEDPVKVGVPVTDMACALYGALAATAALLARGASGAGQYIDVSLFESAVSLTVWEAGLYFATGQVPAPSGSAHQASAPYQAFRASNGWLTLGATTRPNWTALCRVLGLESLVDDPRYGDANLRHANRAALAAEIEAVTSQQTVEHWISALERAGVPCAPIQDMGQVFHDAALESRDFFWDAPHPTLGTVRQLGSPMRFSKSAVRRERAAPSLGQDTVDVLTELGYSAARIDELLTRGIVTAKGRGQRV